MTTGSVATSAAAASAAASGAAVASDGLPVDAERADARDGSKQLRDIEELVAKLAIITRQLAFPARAMPSPRHPDAGQPAANN
jgi:hypothetical protein